MRYEIKLSFRIKLALTVSLLAIALSSTGMWIIYRATCATTMERMGKNLLDVGRLGMLR
ncbi:MAG: hypothetical protein J7K75_00950 [Desulfuromonas sp.]|nr:hypothetical protein [Desulfuromonas sp.]